MKTFIITLVIIFNIPTNYAQRAIPDDNLAYPVLIILENGHSGTGFYVNTQKGVFLVTAKHVLFDTKNNLKANNGDFISYSKSPSDKGKNQLKIDLKFLHDENKLKYHPNYDIAIIQIGENTIIDTLNVVNLYDNVSLVSSVSSGIVTLSEENVKSYDDVLVANDVYIFGYPTSIGIQAMPQFDYLRPLLRKGIVAGKVDDLKTIILDCPVYFGNSGGPVLELTFKGLTSEFRVIGVVTEFIPFAEKWTNETQKYSNISISNSGYSVCVSMDVVLKMINETK